MRSGFPPVDSGPPGPVVSVVAVPADVNYGVFNSSLSPSLPLAQVLPAAAGRQRTQGT